MPEWLITDGGPHFKNRALELMAQRMGIEHHITLAHCPWANGSVEIVGYDLLFTLRNILNEFELMPTEWPDVLPLVQYVINHRPRPALGDRVPST